MQANTWKAVLWVSLQKIAPQHLISRFAGWVANHHFPWLTQAIIRRFVRHFQVDMTIALQPNLEEYSTFNDFFTRQLAPGARNIETDTVIASPVDGTVAQIGTVDEGKLIQAKGHDFSVQSLLADHDLASTFQQGLYTTLYLAPKDYHRIHMPMDGKLVMMRYIPGCLYSVNDVTQTHVPGLFSKNERLVCHFETELGPMCLVLVGAMIVGSIATEWAGVMAPSRSEMIQSWHYPEPINFEQGDDIAHFRLGSTVIMLVAEKCGRQWLPQWQPQTSIMMGEKLS